MKCYQQNLLQEELTEEEKKKKNPSIEKNLLGNTYFIDSMKYYQNPNPSFRGLRKIHLEC